MSGTRAAGEGARHCQACGRFCTDADHAAGQCGHCDDVAREIEEGARAVGFFPLADGSLGAMGGRRAERLLVPYHDVAVEDGPLDEAALAAAAAAGGVVIVRTAAADRIAVAALAARLAPLATANPAARLAIAAPAAGLPPGYGVAIADRAAHHRFVQHASATLLRGRAAAGPFDAPAWLGLPAALHPAPGHRAAHQLEAAAQAARTSTAAVDAASGAAALRRARADRALLNRVLVEEIGGGDVGAVRAYLLGDARCAACGRFVDHRTGVCVACPAASAPPQSTATAPHPTPPAVLAVPAAPPPPVVPAAPPPPVVPAAPPPVDAAPAVVDRAAPPAAAPAAPRRSTPGATPPAIVAVAPAPLEAFRSAQRAYRDAQPALTRARARLRELGRVDVTDPLLVAAHRGTIAAATTLDGAAAAIAAAHEVRITELTAAAGRADAVALAARAAVERARRRAVTVARRYDRAAAAGAGPADRRLADAAAARDAAAAAVAAAAAALVAAEEEERVAAAAAATASDAGATAATLVRAAADARRAAWRALAEDVERGASPETLLHGARIRVGLRPLAGTPGGFLFASELAHEEVRVTLAPPHCTCPAFRAGLGRACPHLVAAARRAAAVAPGDAPAAGPPAARATPATTRAGDVAPAATGAPDDRAPAASPPAAPAGRATATTRAGDVAPAATGAPDDRTTAAGPPAARDAPAARATATTRAGDVAPVGDVAPDNRATADTTPLPRDVRLPLAQIVRRLGLSERTVRELIDRGLVDAARQPNGWLLLDPVAVLRAHARRLPADAAPPPSPLLDARFALERRPGETTRDALARRARATWWAAADAQSGAADPASGLAHLDGPAAIRVAREFGRRVDRRALLQFPEPADAAALAAQLRLAGAQGRAQLHPEELAALALGPRAAHAHAGRLPLAALAAALRLDRLAAADPAAGDAFARLALLAPAPSPDAAARGAPDPGAVAFDAALDAALAGARPAALARLDDVAAAVDERLDDDPAAIEAARAVLAAAARACGAPPTRRPLLGPLHDALDLPTGAGALFHRPAPLDADEVARRARFVRRRAARALARSAAHLAGDADADTDAGTGAPDAADGDDRAATRALLAAEERRLAVRHDLGRLERWRAEHELAAITRTVRAALDHLDAAAPPPGAAEADAALAAALGRIEHFVDDPAALAAPSPFLAPTGAEADELRAEVARVGRALADGTADLPGPEDDPTPWERLFGPQRVVISAEQLAAYRYHVGNDTSGALESTEPGRPLGLAADDPAVAAMRSARPEAGAPAALPGGAEGGRAAGPVASPVAGEEAGAALARVRAGGARGRSAVAALAAALHAEEGA